MNFVYYYIFELIEYYYGVTRYISDEGNPDIEKNSILRTCYNKAALDLLGICKCLRSGLEIQSLSILRNLFENSIDIKIIFEVESEIENRINLFNNFSHVNRWKHIEGQLEAQKKYSNIKINLSEEKIEEYLKEYEKIKTNYHFNKQNPHWAGKIFENKLKSINLFNLCDYFGEEVLHDFLLMYPTASISTHNAPILHDYYTINNVSLNSPKYSSEIYNHLVIAASYCNQIINPIVNYLKPRNYQKKLLSLNLIFKQIMDKSTMITNLKNYNVGKSDIGINSQEIEALNLGFLDILNSYLPLKLKLLEKENTSKKNSQDQLYYSFLRIYLYSIFENLFFLFMIISNDTSIFFQNNKFNWSKNYYNHLSSFTSLVLHSLTCRDYSFVLLYGFFNKSTIDLKIKSVLRKSYDEKEFESVIIANFGNSIPVSKINEFYIAQRFRNYFAHRFRLPWKVINGIGYYERDLFNKILNDSIVYDNDIKPILQNIIAYENKLDSLKIEDLISSSEILLLINNNQINFFNLLFNEIEKKI